MLKPILILILSFAASFAHSAPQEPSDLMYLDKPIDPVCFFIQTVHTNAINLKKCGAAKEKYRILKTNEMLTKKGFYGFDWAETSVKQAGPNGIHGYSYYKYWPADKNRYWLYNINSGGGSGDFTSIHLFERINSHFFHLQTIASGDRCNGGIVQVKENASKLNFSVNITAAEFLDLAKDNPHHLRPYNDLAACAVCCAATVNYEVGSDTKPKLISVNLGDNDKPEEMPTQGKYQACFNKLIATSVAQGKSVLTGTELKKLVSNFNQKCVKH